MAVLMVSPEGAQSQVSTTEAEYLKTLGWKERSYNEYKSKVVIAPETDTMEAPTQKRMGRPKRVDVSASGDKD